MNRQMNLKVNIINEKGIIIASAFPERIGDFHMIAHEIIEKEQSISITSSPSDDLIGVHSPGVNMRLVCGGRTIGVIGVSGIPDEILNLAKMVKLTFETMYEMQKSMQLHFENALSDLSFSLFYEEPINQYNIKKTAEKLRIRDHCPRIPIYISSVSSHIMQQFTDWYSSCPLYHSRDIILPLDSGILFCKSLDKYESDSPHQYAGRCVDVIKNGFFSSAKQNFAHQRYYISTVFEDFCDYRILQRCFHLLSKRTASQPDDIYYMMDYLIFFLVHENREFLAPFFSGADKMIKNYLEPEQFMETVSGLIQNDMNATSSASQLHLHKNSMLARIRKMKETLGINPLSSTRDAVYLAVLYELLYGINAEID